MLEDERTLSPVDGPDPERGMGSGQLATDPQELDPPGSAQRDKAPEDSAPAR